MTSLPVKRHKQHHAKKKKDKKGKTLIVEDLKTLGFQLLSSRAHINNLPILLSVLSPSSPADLVLESLISLQSFFLPLLPEVPSTSFLSKQTGADEGTQDFYRSWLRDRFDDLVNSLIEIFVSNTTIEAIKVCIFSWIVLDPKQTLPMQGRLRINGLTLRRWETWRYDSNFCATSQRLS